MHTNTEFGLLRIAMDLVKKREGVV
jgi:hypothetical protein